MIKMEIPARELEVSWTTEALGLDGRLAVWLKWMRTFLLDHGACNCKRLVNIIQVSDILNSNCQYHLFAEPVDLFCKTVRRYGNYAECYENRSER